MMNKTVFNYHAQLYKVFSGILLLLMPLITVAQQGKITVKGIVYENTNNEPLAGINVQVKGGNGGTITDIDGTFSIDAGQNDILVISGIGFETQEIDVTGREEITVKLSQGNSSLNEVLIVGYDTRSRKDVVGAVTKVDASEINRIPVASVDAQLQGVAAGVQINSNSGVPGEGINVRVRGTTSVLADNNPLYIVDGVFINNTSLQNVNTGGRTTSPIADINPTDIVSIEVLKDASATAIYGARGANGVIIITTKRGDYNSGPKISLNASGGVAWAPDRYLWKLADGPTTAQAVNESYINTQLDRGTDYETAYNNRPFRPVSEGGRGNPEDQKTYDRISEALRTAKLNDYDLSVQGGSNKTKYYIAGAYTSQESVMKVANFRRASLKANIDQKINDNLTIGLSNTLTRSWRDQIGGGNGPQGNIISNGALILPTYAPLFNADGTYNYAGGRDNVLILAEDTDIKTLSSRYIGNLFAEYKIIDGLKFRTSWSLDYNNYDEKGYWSDRMLQGLSSGGYSLSSISQNTTWINEQTLSYRKVFGGQHTFGALVGNSLQGNTLKNTTGEGSGFPNNSYKLLSAASIQSVSESWTGSTLASFFGRVDYNYDSKYFVEASLRADGSSRFGSDNRWGYFPSVGAAWRIKEENFLKNSTVVHELKLRASYGITGNQNGINDFAARGLWTGGANYTENAGSNYSAGTAPFQLANPNLKWERNRQINAGIDIGLFERLNLEINVYNKYTTDALLQVPLPSASGYTSYITNAGEISNRGIELGISSQNIKTKDFTWSTHFNIAANRNRVEKLIVPVNFYGRDWIRLEEGESVNSFWVYEQLYVDPQTGDAVYDDVNGDGQLTAADRKIMGSAIPKFFGGLTNTFTYKGFDLSFLFTFQGGNKIINLNRFLSMNGGTRAERSLYQDDVDYWKKPGDVTDIPRFTQVGTNWNLETTTRFLEDASFLRLKLLTFGYTLPSTLTNRFKVSGLRVYVTGTNLWLLTPYTGADPESTTDASQMVQGIDFGTPPQPVGLQFGINLTF